MYIFKGYSNINIDRVALPIIDSTKNLGLIIDTDFRFKGYVKKMLQKSFVT